MAPRAMASALALLAVGCSPAAGTSPGGNTPATGALCSAAADCDDANVCTSDACSTSGQCAYGYLASTADAILAGSPTGALVTLPIPATPLSVAGVVATACPDGSDPLASPPVCVLELDFANATLGFEQLADWSYRITGSVPIRAQRLPVTGTAQGVPFSGDLTVTGNGACPGTDATFAPVSLTVDFSENPVHVETLSVTATVDAAALGASITACGGGLFASLASAVIPLLAPALSTNAEGLITALVAPELCLTPPCPARAPEAGGICRVSPGGACAVRGIDAGTGMLVIPACAP